MKEVKYVSAQEISDLWGITKRRVQNLCVNNRIDGVVRIGNMWAIPADAEKPKDARMRERNAITAPQENLMRKTRRELKAIVNTALLELQRKGLSPLTSLQTLVVFFASKLLEAYIDDPAICLSVCENFFDYKISASISTKTKLTIETYISKNRACLDDSLSWVYQYGSRKSSEFRYKDTQFFTEKYMIYTLVDSLQLSLDSRVIDPACGGGNFLLYSAKVLSDCVVDKQSIEDRVTYALDNLYGYEIDPFLAFIASFNLKVKALALISKERNVTIETFESFHPKVFYPQKDSLSGFLDVDWEKQIVINCDSGQALRLADVFDGANTVVTNPPFRTVKGMPTEQRKYLREKYPLAKCDMCNAFIERVMDVLPKDGKAAFVTQTSWMYLDSFAPLRVKLLTEYMVNDIWELGSNAFYNLSGEKANVALVTFTKKTPDKGHRISQRLLRNMSIEQIERAVGDESLQPLFVKQDDILKSAQSRFDMVSTEHLKRLQLCCQQYKEYAVPMQGTSTGDARNLIDYYWKHIGDEDWVLVSKGGGYSRFEGLNSYCVKWGRNGESIKNTKGSAIRNADFFDRTQLVFSDTGTAGLNVRILMPGQIFVASGPGIRINKGKELAHLAFLNSRFAAFYVRLISPKLTIAAGYIGQIPVTGEILDSTILEKCAERCLSSKVHRLSKRPNNIEFSYVKHLRGKSISDMARIWFTEDIEDEWEQLQNEQIIEDLISKEMSLTSEDLNTIDTYIGARTIRSKGDRNQGAFPEESYPPVVLGFDCLPKKTKAHKGSLGTDGLLEHIAQIKGISCEEVYLALPDRFDLFKNSYINLYMHALILSALKYREIGIGEFPIEDLISAMNLSIDSDTMYAEFWIEKNFNDVHSGSFAGEPLYKYDPERRAILRIEE